MNILITGGSGLVGTSLKNYNLKDVNVMFLSSKDCDLRNKDECELLFKSNNFKVVIHLASLVAGLYGNMDNNYQFFVENNYINTNILECCRKYNVRRLINVLSTCIFPEQSKTNLLTFPLTSDQILNGKPHFSNSGYAHSKRSLYIGSKLLTKFSDIEIINLIPTNLYGEYDNYNLHKSHVIPALIHKIYLAKKENKSLIIKGSGNAYRQFVYVNDLSKIIINFISLDLKKQLHSLIISPSKDNEISIKQLVDKLVFKFKFTGKIIYDDDFQDGQEHKTADSTELLQYFPDFQFTSLSDGLDNTINYFITHFNNIRK
jgi:GDP-L-fucose synthase